jgi:hypothetical protein
MTETCDSCGKPAYPEGNGRLYSLPSGEDWCRACCWYEGIWEDVKEQREADLR